MGCLKGLRKLNSIKIEFVRRGKGVKCKNQDLTLRALPG
jgi:hypothetical protein